MAKILVRHNNEKTDEDGFFFINWRSERPDLISEKGRKSAIEIEKESIPEKPEETEDYRYRGAINPKTKEYKFFKVERTERQKIQWKVANDKMKIADVEDEKLREQLKEMYPDKD